MQVDIILVTEVALAAACASFAYFQGRLADRLGSIWYGVNLMVGVVTNLAGLASPVVQLVLDGIFALGLLPLAMIYVNYWMGLLTFIAAALFTLEAAYLLNDRAVDLLYLWINNILWLSAPLVLLVCGITNWRRHRRAARAERRPNMSAVPA